MPENDAKDVTGSASADNSVDQSETQHHYATEQQFTRAGHVGRYIAGQSVGGKIQVTSLDDGSTETVTDVQWHDEFTLVGTSDLSSAYETRVVGGVREDYDNPIDRAGTVLVAGNTNLGHHDDEGVHVHAVTERANTRVVDSTGEYAVEVCASPAGDCGHLRMGQQIGQAGY